MSLADREPDRSARRPSVAEITMLERLVGMDAPPSSGWSSSARPQARRAAGARGSPNALRDPETAHPGEGRAANERMFVGAFLLDVTRPSSPQVNRFYSGRGMNRAASSSGCPYTSAVIATEAWPSCLLTTSNERLTRGGVLRECAVPRAGQSPGLRPAARAVPARGQCVGAGRAIRPPRRRPRLGRCKPDPKRASPRPDAPSTDVAVGSARRRNARARLAPSRVVRVDFGDDP